MGKGLAERRLGGALASCDGTASVAPGAESSEPRRAGGPLWLRSWNRKSVSCCSLRRSSVSLRFWNCNCSICPVKERIALSRRSMRTVWAAALLGSSTGGPPTVSSSDIWARRIGLAAYAGRTAENPPHASNAASAVR